MYIILVIAGAIIALLCCWITSLSGEITQLQESRMALKKDNVHKLALLAASARHANTIRRLTNEQIGMLPPGVWEMMTNIADYLIQNFEIEVAVLQGLRDCLLEDKIDYAIKRQDLDWSKDWF